jgi:DNA-directed RNA polymerase subunit RPC12/RpoP
LGGFQKADICNPLILPTTAFWHHACTDAPGQVDLLIPSMRVAIEIDGNPWHSGEKAEQRDIQKSEILTKHGYVVIRIRDKNLNEISATDVFCALNDHVGTCVSAAQAIKAHVAHLDPEVVSKLENYISHRSFLAEDDYHIALTKYPHPEVDESLATVFPELAAEWDFETNHPLTPEFFMPYSGQKVAWVCAKCGHHWKASILNRARGRGCPECRRSIAAKNASRYAIERSGTLAEKFPELAKEWHPTKNLIRPDEVAPRSNRKAHWICGVCGNEWESVIGHRADGIGCPYCSSKRASPQRNLAVTEPEVAKFFDYAANAPLRPEDFTPRSGKLINWVCENGHTWQRSADKQVQYGARCPICSKS